MMGLPVKLLQLKVLLIIEGCIFLDRLFVQTVIVAQSTNRKAVPSNCIQLRPTYYYKYTRSEFAKVKSASRNDYLIAEKQTKNCSSTCWYHSVIQLFADRSRIFCLVADLRDVAPGIL